MGSRRFEITETAGSVKGFYVVVDRETGVNYLVAKFGTGGGICPLIDKDGKPIISELQCQPSQSTASEWAAPTVDSPVCPCWWVIKGRQQKVLPPFPIIEERGIFHD